MMGRQFRVVDLVSVVAVVGLMLGIFIGPLFTGRRQGCRIRCSNSVRQIALALIQYLNTNEGFPPSEITRTGTSGFMMALPYLENQDLYNAYNFALPRWATENSAVVSQNIGILCCLDNTDRSPTPASSVRHLDGSKDPGSSSYAKGHYAVNWGGGRGGWGRDFEKTVGQNRGVMRPVTDINMIGPLPLIGSADLKDGASTTILVTEKRDGQGWAVGGWAGSEFDVGTSPAMNTGNPWGDKVYSGSYHNDGVNFSFCDGSTHFVNARIDRKVWYALITRDGGEAINPIDPP